MDTAHCGMYASVADGVVVLALVLSYVACIKAILSPCPQIPPDPANQSFVRKTATVLCCSRVKRKDVHQHPASQHCFLSPLPKAHASLGKDAQDVLIPKQKHPADNIHTTAKVQGMGPLATSCTHTSMRAIGCDATTRTPTCCYHSCSEPSDAVTQLQLQHMHQTRGTCVSGTNCVASVPVP